MKTSLFFLLLFLLLVSQLRSHCLVHAHEASFYFLLSFIVLTLIGRCLLHFQLIFIQRVSLGVQLHSFACGQSVVPESFVERSIFFPIEWSWHSFETQLTVNIRVYFWILNSVPLICMSVFWPAPHCFDFYSFVVTFEIRKYQSSNFVLFFF